MVSFCAGAEWKVVWSDDFDQPQLDARWWNVVHGTAPVGANADCHGSGCDVLGSCREAACLRDDVSVRDGRLVLTSQRRQALGRNYTTGAVTTRGRAAWHAAGGADPYRLGVAAILPGVPGRAAGVWPAHWMMPDE